MPANPNKMNSAALYARYSSPSQGEQSIEGQLSDCYEFAAPKNIARK